jgi:hypothetical protein|nr:HpaII family restriction endonuclease [uncultured Lachnoclostridium sp.]
MIKGNKGEWSELYVLLKLLADGKIYAADDQVQKLGHIYFPILKILREEVRGRKIEYSINEQEIELYINNKKIKNISREMLDKEAQFLYNQIVSGINRTFGLAQTEEFIRNLECTKLSASSTNKTDILIQIHDIHTGYEPICGFSIKSELGSEPTLLNASGATNFVYEVLGISDEQMIMINSLDNPKSKIKDRMDKIFSIGNLRFVKTKNNNFATNLMLIDSRMEEFMGEILLCYYRDNESDCMKIIQKIEERNPLNYPKKGFYEFKFKKFLCSVALGMMPSKNWNGRDEANGGYIIVKSDGDVLAYHIYNRDYFENYLINNTKLERGSTSKHGFASIYKENEKMYINLNLQVRFK